MTHNDDLQRTPHPGRGGGSIAYPDVKGERGGVGNGNTYHGVPLRGGEGGARTPPPLREGAMPLPRGNGWEPLWAGEGRMGPSPSNKEQEITP